MQKTPLITGRTSIFLEYAAGCIDKAFRTLFHDHLHLIKAKAGRKIESKYIISVTDLLGYSDIRCQAHAIYEAVLIDSSAYKRLLRLRIRTYRRSNWLSRN